MSAITVITLCRWVQKVAGTKATIVRLRSRCAAASFQPSPAMSRKGSVSLTGLTMDVTELRAQTIHPCHGNGRILEMRQMEGSRARLVVVVEGGVAQADGHRWDQCNRSAGERLNRVDTEFGM